MSTVEQEQEQHGASFDGGWFQLSRRGVRAFSGVAMQRGVKTVVAEPGEVGQRTKAKALWK